MSWTCSQNGGGDEECTQKSDGEISGQSSTWRFENMIKMDVVEVVSDDGR